MRSIIQKTAVIIALAVSLWGCGSGNGNAPNFNSTSGKHSFGWLAGPASHGVKLDSGANVASDCVGCHGPAATLSGGVGPACRTCHTLSPLTNPGCTSCHGNPPNGDPAISAGFPNKKGAHDVHNALNKVTGVCATCHNGGGFGTLNHFSQVVNISILADYNAKTGGPATYQPDTSVPITDPNNNGGRCLNISCHGGRTTPPFRTGAINPNIDCTTCHQSRSASDQFNSYFSGRPVTDQPQNYASLHDFHLQSIGLSCTDCHDTNRLAPDTSNHFKFLNTTTLDITPATTIRADINYVAGSCTPANNSNSLNIGCHGTHSWTTIPPPIVFPPSGVSFSKYIQPIFDSYCLFCHAAGGIAGFMLLQQGVSYANLVNVPSVQQDVPGIRVKPGDSTNSVLYIRVSGILPDGTALDPLGLHRLRMPQGGPFLDTQDPGAITAIKTWIDEGALNN